ncbi:PadR family transcriptional regulator [Paracoccus sp. SCSIO 75233]|uniref:PadR family transcriptional regulator n=1 Tax=Paracoccus sp. SCSIO 75233 TaxID=3017782 RepID=UPI0022F0D5BE|nr:PadR family transcriptional regulator [Paracoccus sp. SCSIO 75233]WBU52694.1 PadR family transcriptional regulator [Paracoccus sp. SCSIO 75233]
MSLNFAILGLLTFQPMSGYTLKTRYFDKSIAHFWPADQAQIYRTLGRLDSDGLVSGETIASDSRPNQRVFSITDQGRAALTGWLGTDQPPAIAKDPFLVQLYFGRLLSRDQMLRVLHARRAEHEKLRQYFDELHLPEASSAEMRRQIIFGGMTLDFARRRERMMTEWLDACIATVSALPAAGD